MVERIIFEREPQLHEDKKTSVEAGPVDLGKLRQRYSELLDARTGVYAEYLEKFGKVQVPEKALREVISFARDGLFGEHRLVQPQQAEQLKSAVKVIQEMRDQVQFGHEDQSHLDEMVGTFIQSRLQHFEKTLPDRVGRSISNIQSETNESQMPRDIRIAEIKKILEPQDERGRSLGILLNIGRTLKSKPGELSAELYDRVLKEIQVDFSDAGTWMDPMRYDEFSES